MEKIMTDNVDTQLKIYITVTKLNWVIFGILCVLSLAFAPSKVFLGILTGGALVTINFALLSRTLKKALDPEKLSGYGSVLGKYYLRFIVTGFIIFLLIAGKVVNPIGLIVGLSIVVLSIMLALVYQIFSEARLQKALSEKKSI